MRKGFVRQLCCALISTCSFAAAAQASDACGDNLTRLQPPAADLPGDADRERLRNCSAIDLYYGLQGKPNLRDARLCAYIDEQEQGGHELPTESAGVLMVIYANGAGVPRDVPLAKHFACEIDWKPEDLQQLLDNIDAHVQSGDAVGVCDVQPFWPVNDICEGYTEAIRAKRLDDAEAAFAAQSPASRREAFAALRKAARAYYDKRKDSEVFQQHHTSNIMWVENNLREEFVNALQAVDAPQGLPARDLPALDRELNAVYRKAMKVVELACADEPGVLAPLTPASLRAGELAWLAYADAWERFRAQAYPNIPADALRALLTAQRSAALKQLRNEFHFQHDYWSEQ